MQWIDAGSDEAYNRIKAEKNRPQCDVWWGAPSTHFMQAAEEGLLEPYQPTWASNVADAYKDAQHRWYGTTVHRSRSCSTIASTRKRKCRRLGTIPSSRNGKGKITFRKPLPSGTMRTFIA